MGFEVRIVLDNPTKRFYPGETFSGNVVVVSDAEKNVKGLSINFYGKANVQFQEHETRMVQNQNRLNLNHGTEISIHSPTTTTESVAVRYQAEENYLSTSINLFGNDGTEVTIPRGRFNYPFGFKLPYGLPSSLEGQHGSVFYYIEAILGRSWAFDCKDKMGFSICGLVDLNNEPMAQQPVETRKSKTFGFFCCESGPLSILLRLSKVGFIPGEFIPFLLEINNNSDKNVKGNLSLIQTITYNAKGKSKSERSVVAEVLGQTVLPGDSDIWQGNILQVPQVPPTNLGGARLINVTYEFKVKMKCSGLSSDLTCLVPVVIGTIGFNQSVGQRVQVQPAYNLAPQGYQQQPHNSSATAPQAYPKQPSSGVPPPYGFNDPGQGGLYEHQDSAYLPPPPYNPDMKS